MSDRPLHAGFPARLRLARGRSGLSLAGLAHATGRTHRQSIAQIEAGHNQPSIALVEDLARALGVRPAWLAYGDGEP